MKKEGKQTEQGPTFQQYQDIVDRAHVEIQWVHSAYKWLLSILAIVILSGLYFTYRSAKDFKFEMKSDGATIKSRLSQEISSLGEELKKNLANQVSELQNQVKSRIDEEFKKENIQLLVKDKSKERIDEIADQIIEQEIKNEISPKIKAVENKLIMVDEELKKSHQSREELKKLSNVMLTIIGAQSGDRDAFDKLKTWATDKSFIWSETALNVYVRIRAKYAGIATPGYLFISWEKDVDPSTYTFSHLQELYASMPTTLHADLLNIIWKRTDIPKKDRMKFLVDVLKSDKCLTAMHYAGKFFAEKAGLTWNPFLTEPLLEWWEKNKENLK